MHSIGKIVLQSAVSALVKGGVSAVVSRRTGKNNERIVSAASTEIQREIDDVKSKLDAVAEKNLLASISFFNEGDFYLCKVFEGVNPGSRFGAVSAELAVVTEKANASFSSTTAWRGVLTLAKLLNGLDDSAKRALCDAKKRFKDARREVWVKCLC